MATTLKAIDKYLVRHYGRKSGEGESQPVANITCFHQSDVVGFINFYLEGNVPESKLGDSRPGPFEEAIMVNFAIDRIDEILDTLRQEKPIDIAVDLDPGGNVGWVATKEEPIGEEEGV